MHVGPAAPVQGFGGGHLREIGPPVLIDTARLLARRWQLVVLAAVLAVLSGVGAVLLTPPDYKSTGQVLFLPPTKQAGVDGLVNPFLALGQALSVTADIVRIGVSDTSTREGLVKQGAIEEYEVTPYLAENGGPILIVTAESSDAQASQRTVGLVVDRITADLRTIQQSASAPTGSYITATLLTETPRAEPSVKPQARAAAIAAPAVLVLLLALIVLGDRVAARRRRAAAARDAETGPATERRGPTPGDAATARERAARREPRAGADDADTERASRGRSARGDRAGASAGRSR